MIHAKEVAYVRYSAPDLDAMQEFLIDFGLQTAVRTADRLYMRTAGSAPFVHVTELGDIRSVGLGLVASSEGDLHTLATHFHAEVKDNPEPGGGKIVTIRDIEGYQVDVVHGMTPSEPIPVRKPIPLNASNEAVRFGRTQALEPGPSHLIKIGHVVLKGPNFPAQLDFYRTVFGFQISDSYFAQNENNMIAAFMHCGLGKHYTDHHSLALIADAKVVIEHSAYEVIDWDDLIIGNAHLASKGYKHSWGVGRHIYGRQIFDYWRDPFGNKLEHETDGDLVNEDYVPEHRHISAEELSQWGPPLNPDFMA